MSSFEFPDDLLQAQRAWYRAYRQLAQEGNPSQTTVLRRTLQRLSVRIATHPYWATIPGEAPAARMALKQQTWESGPAEARR
ncbi:hypothetical protein SAMN05428945_6591 [Streptomyces sp. 2224.1]|uniref:hypothetical protein n=1 Tax=unclassified Streptomyces TaxID=2593676 RepID=UPI0008908EFF|nr:MULTISPECIES: hypothetical protein [unclassified Streptomyces]PBC85937.1 hypothetical protein BX261_5978 [Streptomyces sp. 2321.6]SDR01704.1 hypothetical protein SAMN05216511_1282 [Streptomyces sp. KS_16]SED83496.1 hypothetical protein SAMN05428940_6003 [Streptomyces sp. 2133.1]SED90394.1 hypothetical protein SAMN05428954_1305 [Streptomyces sp. 2112.3]SEE15944.1 hypothetical protein SAMN05428945_6591 [Streptomyces sp. 2224.1]